MNETSTRSDLAAVADKMSLLRRQFLENVTTNDLVAIVRKMIERAIEGSLPAAKMVLGYILGRPGSPLPDEPAPMPKTARSTITKRTVTAPQSVGSVVPPRPSAPAMTPEMERFLSQPLTAEELNEAKRTKLVGGR